MSAAVIPPEALEGVMRKAFVDGTVAVGLFWDALLKSNLFIPLAEKNSEAAQEELRQGRLEEVPMLLGVDSTGRHVIWLFTSVGTMIEYTERELPHVELNAVTLFSNILESEHDVVLIGPDALTLSLHPNLIATLATGKTPEPPEEKVRYVTKDTQLFVGPPEDDTAYLEERFSALFRTLPDVLEAAFLQVTDGAGSRLLLGLRLTDDSRTHLTAVSKKVAEVSEGALNRGKTMDVTLMGGSLKEAFQKWGKIFFKR